MSFEAYSVAIRLRLLDSVSTGLTAMAAQFGAFNRHVNRSQASLKALEGQLKTLKMMGFLGGAAVGIGAVGLVALAAPLKAAREYELAFTKFKTLNLGDAVNKQADQFARGANLMGVSATQLLTTMSESVGVFGRYSEAQRFAPKIAQLNMANAAIFHGKVGEIDEGSTRALIKFMDRRGLKMDDAGFTKGLDLAERLVTGSGGFIKFNDLANFSQMGGTAFRSLSDTGVMNMALLLQEQGGSRAGQSMMSIYQNLVAGRTPKKTMALLEQMGLGSMSSVTSGTVGGKRSTTSTFNMFDKYSSLLQSDPMEFFRSVWLPLLAKRGITTQAGILKTTNDLLSNRNASGQASIASTQLLQVWRDAALTKNAMGSKQVIDAFKKDPNARWADLMAKWKNLMIEIGEAALPLVTRAAGLLIRVLSSATHFAHTFPGATKLLIGAFVSLSALMVVGGAVTLIIAGFKGLGLALAIGKAAGLGARLSSVAIGMTGLATAAGVLGAAVAGYALGKVINSAGPDGDLGAWLAGKVHGLVHPYANSPSVHHTHVHLDGQKIATVVTKHQARSAGRPQTGVSSHDIRQSLPAAGLVGGGL